MMETKNILQSKTVWGVLILLASFVLLKTTNIEVSEEVQADLVDKVLPVIETIMALVGSVLAIYGRIVVNKSVRLI